MTQKVLHHVSCYRRIIDDYDEYDDDNNNYDCIIDNNNFIKKISGNKINIMELIDIGKYEKNNNILSVILENGDIDKYYLINNDYYNKKYIDKYFEIIIISIENNIFDSILYNDNCIYIPDFSTMYGKYELINDLLIINWENGIFFFNIFEKNIYIKNNTDDFYIKFDIIYYQKQINDFSLKDKNEIIRHWYIYGRNSNISNKCASKIIINGCINNIIINYSNEHIYNIDKNIYYKFKNNENNYLLINFNFFNIIDKNIIFNDCNDDYKYFINKKNIYEECVSSNLIHPEYIKKFYI